MGRERTSEDVSEEGRDVGTRRERDVGVSVSDDVDFVVGVSENTRENVRGRQIELCSGRREKKKTKERETDEGT